MKKIFAALGIVTFAVVGCDDSSSASSNDDPGVESSSSEAVFSSSSSEQFFVPSEYRTCDKKYEGKFLLYQYRETLDALYGTYRVNTVFYKCKNGKWSGPSAASPENLTEGDVIRAAPDDWECNAENEGQVQSWRFMVFAVPHSPMGYTPTYYARCEQGDWVLCEPESSSSSSEKAKSSSSKEENTKDSSSSVKSSSSKDPEHAEGSSSSSSGGVCTDGETKDVETVPGYTLQMVCDGGKWVVPEKECTAENIGEKRDFLGMPQVCTKDGWISDDPECTAENEGDTLKSTIVGVEVIEICHNGEWVHPRTLSSSSSTNESSSSADVQSSSSETESSSSSSEDKVDCSALLEGESGWSWNVPKECRFNPDIDYGSMTDERDGKTYKTVKIGDQTWMAENLNYYDASDLNVKEKSWCFGKKDNGDSSTCDVAGRFYTWAAAIDSVKLANDADNPLECGYDKFCNLTGTVQGICPPGWHLPNNTEWQAFLMAVGGRSTAGKVLKSQTGWNDYKGTSGNGTDAFGFTALPAGFRFCDGGDFHEEGKYTYFWSSVEYERDCETNANNVYVYYYGDNANLYFYPKIYAFSVRCVKD